MTKFLKPASPRRLDEARNPTELRRVLGDAFVLQGKKGYFG
jgi:hypothetical protein